MVFWQDQPAETLRARSVDINNGFSAHCEEEASEPAQRTVQTLPRTSVLRDVINMIIHSIQKDFWYIKQGRVHNTEITT